MSTSILAHSSGAGKSKVKVPASGESLPAMSSHDGRWRSKGILSSYGRKGAENRLLQFLLILLAISVTKYMK
jgi:hypothetical protein